MLKSKAIIDSCCQSLIRDGPWEVLAVSSHDHHLPLFSILRDSSIGALRRFGIGMQLWVITLPQIYVVFVDWIRNSAFTDVALGSYDLTLHRLILGQSLPLFSSFLHKTLQLLQIRFKDNRIQQIVRIIVFIYAIFRILCYLFWGLRVTAHFPVLANFYQLTLILKIFSPSFIICYKLCFTGDLILLYWLPVLLGMVWRNFGLEPLWQLEFSRWECIAWLVLLFRCFSAFS
jgi:hypothetical protein